MSYTKEVQRGSALHDAGNHLEAAHAYVRALDYSQTDEEYAYAALGAGICFFLAGQYDHARTYMELAEDYATSYPARRALVLRNLGILDIKEDHPKEAQDRLRDALKIQFQLGLEHDHAVTKVYLARAYHLNRDRGAALATFAEAHAELGNQDVRLQYELLSWWMKALGPVGRLLVVPLALRLIVRATRTRWATKTVRKQSAVLGG